MANTIYEYCPYCEDEVELKWNFDVQICPNCGRPIVPCSLCEGCKGNCPLEYKAKAMYKEMGFND